MMICAVKPRRTDQSEKAFCSASSMPLMSRERLSLKDVPKLTTRSSLAPMSSQLRGSSFLWKRIGALSPIVPGVTWHVLHRPPTT